MAANITPIYTRTPDIQFTGTLNTANNIYDGSGTLGTNILAVFTADATEGGFLYKIRCKSVATTTATVARFFINNGSTNGTASNNVLFEEVTLPATTAASTGQTITIDVPFNIALPAGYRILVVTGTASGGWQFTAIGGKY